jgi:hypothetical protein
MDVSSVGLSGQGTKYELKGITEIESSFSPGVRYGRLIYCPNKEIEFNPTIRARTLRFVDTERPELSELKRHTALFGIGSDIKKIISRRFELVGETELSQDIELLRNSLTQKIQTHRYFNFKLLAGVRYFIANEEKVDWTLKAMTGALVPINESGNAKVGPDYKISTEFFFKTGNRSALSFDFFHEKSSQQFSDAKLSRRDVGVLTSLVFRW